MGNIPPSPPPTSQRWQLSVEYDWVTYVGIFRSFWPKVGRRAATTQKRIHKRQIIKAKTTTKVLNRMKSTMKTKKKKDKKDNWRKTQPEVKEK